MYNYSQVVMKQNIYCLNYFKKIKNVQACYNCLETGFKTAIGIIQVWATFKKVIKLLPLLEALVIVFTLVNLSSTKSTPQYTGTILASDVQGTRISIKDCSSYYTTIKYIYTTTT